MVILDGKNLSKTLLNELKNVLTYNNLTFACILVGNDPASKTYVNNKKKKCIKLGIQFILLEFPDNVSNEILINKIDEINEDDNINGCIIQLPLPDHINTEVILNRLDGAKDVDCFTNENVGKLINNKSKFYPATPYGITLLLDNYNIATKGKNITIIGKSRIVGIPLALLLSNENTYAGTVTLCDKNTINLKDHIENANILIVCAGVHRLIDKKYKVKESSTLIDVGIHRIPDSTKKNGYRLEGDIDFNFFKDKCSYITPVPGGVGPMTVYSLLLNITKTINV